GRLRPPPRAEGPAHVRPARPARPACGRQPLRPPDRRQNPMNGPSLRPCPEFWGTEGRIGVTIDGEFWLVLHAPGPYRRLGRELPDRPDWLRPDDEESLRTLKGRWKRADTRRALDEEARTIYERGLRR